MRYLLLLCLCWQSAMAATYYVRTDGDDGATGTANHANPATGAWRSLAYAASRVVPGDTVYVGPGTYAEQFVLTRPGTAVNPIRWYGDRTGGTWNTIIDRSIPWTSGWVLATGPGIAPDVYTNALPYEPGLLKADGKSVVNIRTPADKFIVRAFEDGRTVDGGDQYPGTWLWWDGVEAAWTWETNVNSASTTKMAWLHFRGGAHPNTKNIRISPGVPGENIVKYKAAAAVTMASYNTLSGFHVRGSAWGVNIPVGCEYSIIESNRVEDGFYMINGGEKHVTSSSVRGNIVRWNTIHANYYGFGGGAWNIGRGQAGWVKNRPYRYLKSYWSEGWATEGSAVHWENVGNSNIVHNNLLTNIAAGIGFIGNQPADVTGVPGVGNVIASNILQHSSSQANWISFATDQTHIHDNQYEDVRFFLRLQGVNYPRAYASRIYYYRNRGWNPLGWGSGCYFHVETGATGSRLFNFQTELWMYHNSFEGVDHSLGIPSDSLKTDTRGTTSTADDISWYYRTNYPFGKFTFINNIFNSHPSGVFGSSLPAALTNTAATLRGFDYNRSRSSAPSAAWSGSHHVAHSDYEWGSGSVLGAVVPSFMLRSGSPSIAKGIDVSDTFSLLGTSYPALPGFSAVYYSGTQPDLGAVPYNFEEVEPPTPGVITNVLSIVVSPPYDTLQDLDAGAPGAVPPRFYVARADRLVGGALVPNTVGDCPFTVSVSSPDGAVAGVDYQVYTTSGQIADGTNALGGFVVVQPLRNPAYTGQRRVRVTLQPGAAYAIQGTSYADAILLDADRPADVLVRPRPQPGHGMLLSP